MKVVVLVNGEGLTQSQYDQLMKNMKFDDNPPKGIVTHIAAFDAKGIRVTDVWENEAVFKKFAETTLTPALAKVGYNKQPKVEVFPLHFMANTEVTANSDAR